MFISDDTQLLGLTCRALEARGYARGKLSVCVSIAKYKSCAAVVYVSCKLAIRGSHQLEARGSYILTSDSFTGLRNVRYKYENSINLKYKQVLSFCKFILVRLILAGKSMQQGPQR